MQITVPVLTFCMIFLSPASYLKQVIDETVRCSVLAPYAARYQDIDIELGGHRVPAGVGTHNGVLTMGDTHD